MLSADRNGAWWGYLILTYVLIMITAGFIDILFPVIFLHAYYACIVGTAVYVSATKSGSLDYLTVGFLLFLSYLTDYNNIAWSEAHLALSLVHSFIALAIANLCDHRDKLYFIFIFLAKVFVTITFVNGILDVDKYVYQAVLNMLSTAALVYLTWISVARAIDVKRGKAKDEIGLSLRITFTWIQRTARNSQF